MAQRCDAHGFKRGFVAGGGDVGDDLGFEASEIGHGDGHLMGARSWSNTRPSSSAPADDPVAPGVKNVGRWLLDAPLSRGMTAELQDAASDFRTYAASAALAFSAIAWNAAGS